MPEAPALHLTLPESDEWPLLQKLQGERETLGHYLSGHPLDPYRDELRGLVGHDLSDLDRMWSERPDEERKGWRPEMAVVIAGQVIGMRKRGDSQAFVQLEDGRGRIECAFFAEAYYNFAQLLTRDRILVIEGGLREDEFSGGFSLRAKRCWDFTQVCSQYAQRLSVKLDLRQKDALAHFEKRLASLSAGRDADAARSDHLDRRRPLEHQRRPGRARGCGAAGCPAQHPRRPHGAACVGEALGIVT